MAYTGEEVDGLAVKFEKCCERQIQVKDQMVKVRAAERDLLRAAEMARDLFINAVKGDKGLLQDVFGGTGLQRFHRFRNAMDQVELTEMHASDQRWDGLRNSMDAIEAVLKTLGIFKPFVKTEPPSQLRYHLDKTRFAPGEHVKLSPELEGGDAQIFLVTPVLPEGLILSNTTGEIRGELKAGVEVPEKKYTITARNDVGQTSVQIAFSVTTPVPTSLAYPSLSPEYTIGGHLELIPQMKGGTPKVWSLTPALPKGLEFNTQNGTISGTPKELRSQTNYTITARNTSGQAVADIAFAVVLVAPASLSYPGQRPEYPHGLVLHLMPSLQMHDSQASDASGTEVPQERRFAEDGVAYTKKEFIEFLGPETAQQQWDNAPPEKEEKRLAEDGKAYTKKEFIDELGPDVGQQYWDHAQPVKEESRSQVKKSPWKRARDLITKLRQQDFAIQMKMLVLNQIEYSIEPSLPAGLVIIKNTGVITGAPSETRKATAYKVTAKNSGGAVSCDVTFAVVIEPPKGLSFPDASVFLVGSPVSLSPTVEGLVERWSVTPDLPDGVQLDKEMGIISGIPTQTAPAGSAWTVVAANEQGFTEAIVKFCVKRPAPNNLRYPALLGKYPVTRPVEDLQPTYEGEADGFVVEPPLPEGLTLNSSTGEISGSPWWPTPLQTYWVTTWNETGSADAQLDFAVAVLPPADLKYPQVDEDYSVGESVNLLPQINGGATWWTVEPAFPQGFVFDETNGVISGAPKVTAEEVSYVVTASNEEGSTSSVLTFSVHDPAPAGLSYPDARQEYTVGENISVVPVIEVGICTAFVVKPALPAGISLDSKCGVVSGSPSAMAGTATYAITGSNSYGSVTCSLTFSCKELAPDGLDYPDMKETYSAGEQVYAEPTLHAGICISFVVTPQLPASLSLDAKSGTISGTLAAVDFALYEVTGSNSSGSTSCELRFECLPKAAPKARPKFERRQKEDHESYAAMLEGITELEAMPKAPPRQKKMQWMLWMVHRAWLSDPTLTEFNFRDMKMPLPHVEPRIAPKLMKALSTNTSIVTLDLGNSNLQKPQGSQLGESLALNNTLRAVCLENNGLDSEALISVINGIRKNEATCVEQFMFAHQKGLKTFGRSLEEQMAEMVERNNTLSKIDIVCADPHWRNKIDKAITRNVELARKQRKHQGATQNKLQVGVLVKIILSHTPEIPSWEVFTGEDQDQCLQIVRRCAVAEKKIPTSASLAAFAKKQGNPMRDSEVAVVLKAFTAKFMGSFLGLKVTLLDDTSVEMNGQLETWSEKNDRWSLNVWLDEGQSCALASTGAPVVELSAGIVDWVRPNEDEAS